MFIQDSSDLLDIVLTTPSQPSTYRPDHVHQARDQASIDDLLDLRVLASGDVGQGPCSFFLNVVLGVSQKVSKHGEGPGIQHRLGLLVCASYNVTNGAQGWSLRMEKSGINIYTFY